VKGRLSVGVRQAEPHTAPARLAGAVTAELRDWTSYSCGFVATFTGALRAQNLGSRATNSADM
jgi:hypothetical protein